MTQKSSPAQSDFISLAEAIVIVPYSRDYIGRLARANKIISKQIGKQWLVSRSSLVNFFEQSNLEESVKKKVLSWSRKNDLEVKDFYTTRVSTILSRSKNVSKASIFATTFLVCGGLLGGSLFYFTAQMVARLSPDANMSQVLSALRSTHNEASSLKAFLTPSQFSESVVLETLDQIPMRQGVVLFPQVASSNAEVVEILFSDNVTLELTGTTTGFVRSADGARELPFVRVPSIVPETSL